MTRNYTLKRRAEQQAETRLRIVEAAMDLHGIFGPARTTFSMIAEQAGVRRHTSVCALPGRASHEHGLLEACTYERSPPPDVAEWRTIEDPRERLQVGLQAIYGWYQRNAALAGCVLRDLEYHALTREVFELRLGPVFAEYGKVLSAGLTDPQRAMLHVALGFATWRALAQDSGLETDAAADAMAKAVSAQ